MNDFENQDGSPDVSGTEQQPGAEQQQQQQYQQQQQQYQQQQPYQQQPYQPQPPFNAYQQKSKVAAGVLGILLGTLGIHNFYLGYTGKAIAQILISLIGGVFTCGIASAAVSIWGLVEGLLILTGSISVDGHGVPLRD